MLSAIWQWQYSTHRSGLEMLPSSRVSTSIIHHASTFSLPTGFLQGGAPELTRFKHSGPEFGWGNLPSNHSNLTVLELKSSTRFTPVTPEVFLETFRQMPLLRALLLQVSLIFTSSVQAARLSGISPLTFPNLHRFRMRDHPQAISDVLLLTRSSTVTSVDLVSPDKSTPAEVVHQSLSNALTFWCQQSKPHVRRLHLAWDGAVTIDFDPVDGTTASLEGDKKLLLSFTDDIGFHSQFQMLKNLFNFRALVSLAIQCVGSQRGVLESGDSSHPFPI